MGGLAARCGLLLCLALLLASCGARSAPPLALYDLEGKKHNLATRRGTPVVVVFWAPWSPLSADQLRAAAAARAAEPSGTTTLLSVAVDPTRGSAARKVAKETAWSGPTLIATPEAVEAWDGLPVLPTLVRLDAQGRITSWQEGFVPEDRVREMLLR